MTHPLQREFEALKLLVPSARKSLGEYKPLLTRREGSLVRTEVLAKARARNLDGNKTYARGTVFATRKDAIAYAEETKLARIDDCLLRAQKYNVALV